MPALETVNVDLIRKFFRKARDYVRTYSEGRRREGGGRHSQDLQVASESEERVVNFFC